MIANLFDSDNLIDFCVFTYQSVKMRSAARKLKIEFLTALFRYLRGKKHLLKCQSIASTM